MPLLIPADILYNLVYVTCVFVWIFFIVNAIATFFEKRALKKKIAEIKKADDKIQKLMEDFVEDMKDNTHDCFDCLPEKEAKKPAKKPVAKKKVVRENK